MKVCIHWGLQAEVNTGFHWEGGKLLYSPLKVLVTFLSHTGCFLLSLLSLADNGHMGSSHSAEPLIQLVLGVVSKKNCYSRKPEIKGGIFTKCFRWIQQIQWQKYLSLLWKGSNLPPNHLLCKRPACYHSASETHVRDKIFKLSQIQASVISCSRFPEFAEFTDFNESWFLSWRSVSPSLYWEREEGGGGVTQWETDRRQKTMTDT